MSKKSILASIFLVFIGIVFGVVLVSNFGGTIQPGFAGEDVRLGAPSQVKAGTVDARGLNAAFIEVSKAVTPTVVAITVVTKAKERPDDNNDFFHFFGPNFKFPEPEPQQGAGSGVIVNPDGYILTNNHVVDEADPDGIEVITDGQKKLKAKLIGTDPSTDLAVIKVDGSSLPTAALGNSDDLQVGEWVLAIGNPLGLQSTVTAGIVSAMGRGNIGVIRDNYAIENFIQTDAAINPGNSGGPLVNLKGEVVGINTAIATTNQRYQGYGFTIPINLAKTVAEDIIKYGKFRRGYLGVNIQTVNETMAKALGLGKTAGVLVQGVVEGGAAEAAGIQKDDVILSVDGKDVTAVNELQTIVARKHPGADVDLKIFRDGRIITKKVQLRSRKEEAIATRNMNDESDSRDRDEEKTNPPVKLDNVGLGIRTMTASERRDAKIDQGVIVTDVKRFSEAYNQGIGEGDVILEIDKKSVSSAADVKTILGKHKAGDAILVRVKRGATSALLALQIPD
jgi:serine protease Do